VRSRWLHMMRWLYFSVFILIYDVRTCNTILNKIVTLSLSYNPRTPRMPSAVWTANGSEVVPYERIGQLVNHRHPIRRTVSHQDIHLYRLPRHFLHVWRRTPCSSSICSSLNRVMCFSASPHFTSWLHTSSLIYFIQLSRSNRICWLVIVLLFDVYLKLFHIIPIVFYYINYKFILLTDLLPYSQQSKYKAMECSMNSW